MISKRFAFSIVTFITLLAFAVGAGVAAGTPPLSAQKTAAQAKVKAVEQQLGSLQVSLERTVQQFDLARMKLRSAQRKVQRSKTQLKLARYELGVARTTLSNRMVAMYKQQPMTFLDVVFSSSSFADISGVIQGWSEIGTSDSQIVDNVQHSIARVKRIKAASVTARAKARTYLAQVNDNKSHIEAQIAQQNQIYTTEKQAVRTIEHKQAVQAQIAAARAAAAERAAAAAATRAATTAAATTPVATATPTPTPSATTSTTSTTTGTAVAAGAGHPEVIAIARHYLGIPYRYGGASPQTGFDCSGFVMYCYAQIGISLPHYSGAQQNCGVRVPMNQLVPGDLVFRGVPVSYHVGMYAGGGVVIHSPHTGAVVSYESVSGWDFAVRIP